MSTLKPLFLSDELKTMFKEQAAKELEEKLREMADGGDANVIMAIRERERAKELEKAREKARAVAEEIRETLVKSSWSPPPPPPEKKATEAQAPQASPLSLDSVLAALGVSLPGSSPLGTEEYRTVLVCECDGSCSKGACPTTARIFIAGVEAALEHAKAAILPALAMGDAKLAGKHYFNFTKDGGVEFGGALLPDAHYAPSVLGGLAGSVQGVTPPFYASAGGVNPLSPLSSYGPKAVNKAHARREEAESENESLVEAMADLTKEIVETPE